MDDNSRQMEGTELLLQVGLSGRVVPLQGIMDTMTVLDIKQQARNEVAKLLGKEFLSTEVMCLLPGDGGDSLKNVLRMEELKAASGSAPLRVIVDSTPPEAVFGLALSDPKNFEGGMDSPLVKALLKWLGEGGASPGHGKDEQRAIVGRFMSLYFEVAKQDDPVTEKLSAHEELKFDFGLIRALLSDVGNFVKTLQPKSDSEQLPCNGTASLALRDFCSSHRECRGQRGATTHPGNCWLSGISNKINPEDFRRCTGFVKDSEQAKALFKAIGAFDDLSMEVDLKQVVRMSSLLSSLAEELKTCQFVGDHEPSLQPQYAPYAQRVRCNGQRLDGQTKQRLAEFVQIFEGIKALFGN